MILFYFILSLAASVVGAISGIGGGIIIKPLMDSISPFSVSTISFLSGSTVLSMTTVALIRSKNSPVSVDRRIGTLLALGGVVGGLLGKYLFDLVKARFPGDQILGASQSLILLAMTLGVLIFTLYKNRITPFHRDGSGFCLFIGILLGTIASFLGIGGGPINLAVLYFFFSMDSKTAALNSLFIIFFSQLTSLAFTMAAGNLPVFDSTILLAMITGGVGGAVIGSAVSARLSHRGVDYLFMGVMGIIILISLRNFLFQASWL